MASTWDRIPQTHRAILFEEFTHPADTSTTNLAALLRFYSDPEAIDEELYLDIEDKLEVRSFDEFLKKFQPKVFRYTTGTAAGVPMFQYTTNPIEAQKIEGASEVKITDTYYEMLVNMYSRKSDSGVANIEFNDAQLREILTPKREIDALYDTRQQIPLLMEKYDKTIKRNENAAPLAKRLKKIRREALDQIKNPTALMAIGLDDINRKIATAEEKLLQLKAASPEGGEVPKLLSGRGGFDDKGRWILIPAKASTPDSTEDSDSPSDPASDSAGRFAKIIKGDLDKRAAGENDFTKALIISAYTGRELANPMENMDSTALAEYREQLLDQKKIIEGSFKQAKEAFIKVLSESVQKLLCVKIFFDHATIKGGNEGTLPKAGLIVANCSPAKLIDDKIKGKFVSTMRHLGLDVSDEHKLWFAILPHVLDEDYPGGSSGSNDRLEDDLDDFDEDIVDVEEDSVNGADFSAAKSILKIMDECKIMTVFNFAPDKRTTFSALNAETIDDLQNKLRPLDMEHAVYALPNFTIMKEGTVPLSDEVKIAVPAMYIDAAYVAAGLLIAAQQPEYWKSRGFKKEQVLLDNPCVRIDFEWDRITPVMLTKFNRERSIAWSADVVKALTKNHFGFAFDGDRKYDVQTNSFIDNTYILNARTLKRKDGDYQPIFRTLTKDFVRAYLKTSSAAGLQLKKDQIRAFLRVAREWEKQVKDNKQDPINLLLREGEKILLDDNNNIRVELSGGEDLVEVEIVD